MSGLDPQRVVRLEDGAVVLLDQRRLPDEELELRCRSAAEVAEAIRTLAVRGAPAIGIVERQGADRAAFLERRVVGRASAVLFVTRANLIEYDAVFGPTVGQKFHLIPNGCDPSEIEQVAPMPTREEFVLLHAGTLYGALERLREMGMIAVDREETVEGRRRRYFRLTAAGVSAATTETERMSAAADAVGPRLAEFVPRREGA